MSLKYIPPNAPSLIVLTGVLFAPKSLYKTSLCFNTELFSLLTASSLLTTHTIYLKSKTSILNIAIFFNS